MADEELEATIGEDGHYNFYGVGEFDGMTDDPDPYGTGYNSTKMLKDEIRERISELEKYQHTYGSTQDYIDTMAYYRQCLEDIDDTNANSALPH